MSYSGGKRLSVTDIETQMVKCKFCNQDVQFGVLPYHQYFCQKAQNKGNQSETGGYRNQLRIMPAHP